MKGMILGLATGFIAGALLVKTCKPCSQFMDDMTGMVQSKMKQCGQQKQQQPSENCECGSDCCCNQQEMCDCGMQD